ncbi:MAG: tyrosine-type recombinase/integrase [Patescibacteria group bacterium]
MATRDLPSAIDAYLRHLETAKHRAVLTCDHYRAYLGSFMEATGAKRIEDITDAAVHAFVARLKKGKISPVTQNYYLIALRNFLRWLPKRERPIPAKAIRLQRTLYRPPRLPDHAALEEILHAPETLMGRNRLLALRDRALLELAYSTGIALHVLAKLQRDNVRFLQGIVITANAKAAKQLPLGVHARKYIKEYLDARSDADPYLFVAHDRGSGTRSRGGALSTRSIQRIFIKYNKAVGRETAITIRTLQHHARAL